MTANPGRPAAGLHAVRPPAPGPAGNRVGSCPNERFRCRPRGRRDRHRRRGPCRRAESPRGNAVRMAAIRAALARATRAEEKQRNASACAGSDSLTVGCGRSARAKSSQAVDHKTPVRAALNASAVRKRCRGQSQRRRARRGHIAPPCRGSSIRCWSGGLSIWQAATRLSWRSARHPAIVAASSRHPAWMRQSCRRRDEAARVALRVLRRHGGRAAGEAACPGACPARCAAPPRQAHRRRSRATPGDSPPAPVSQAGSRRPHATSPIRPQVGSKSAMRRASPTRSPRVRAGDTGGCPVFAPSGRAPHRTTLRSAMPLTSLSAIEVCPPPK